MTLDRPLVGLDFETTGTDVEKDRIVQIAYVWVRADGVTHRWSSLVNPGIPIPAEATAVHGITDEMVKDAPRFRDLAAQMKFQFEGCDFAGYNVRFDLRVLDAEMRRAPLSWSYQDARIIDAYRLWQIVSPRTLGGAVKEYLHREPTDAHDAVADVDDSLALIEALLAKHPELPRTRDELHALQWPEDASKIDVGGKFIFRADGVPVMNFGKYKGMPLRDVDRGFLKWMINKGDFHPTTLDVVADALRGAYPARVNPPASETLF